MASSYFLEQTYKEAVSILLLSLSSTCRIGREGEESGLEEMSCIEDSEKVEAVETIEIWKRLVMKKAVGVHNIL